MCNIGKWPSMNKDRRSLHRPYETGPGRGKLLAYLQGLHERRLDCVPHEHRHGPGAPHIFCSDRLPTNVTGDNNSAQARQLFRPQRNAWMTIQSYRSRMSRRSDARARIAMHSLATAILNPVSRVFPFSSVPRPTLM